MPKKYIIVGGNVAGTSAAARLRRLDEFAQITVFDKGSGMSFASGGLPYYIGGVVSSADSLTRGTPENFLNNLNITVKTRCEAVGIDRHNKSIKVYDITSGTHFDQKYDKLILATGAVPHCPDIKAAGRPDVFMLKNIEDMERISRYIKEADVRRAAVIGGGDVGLAVAENISRRGIKTCVIEKKRHVLPTFDAEMARFAKITLENNGVALITDTVVADYQPIDEGLRLELSDGRSIIADMVVICAGLKPETRLAAEAGLGIGFTGGILVDEHQQTTDKDIYAVGDTVEVESTHGGKILISRASPATRQARIAADSICGIGSRYKHTLGVTIVKLFDTCFGAAGLTEQQLVWRGLKYEKVYLRALSHENYYPEAEVLSVKLCFDKRTGRIYGVQVAGKTGVDKRIDVFATAMYAGLTVGNLAELELAYAPPFSAPRDVVNMAGYIAGNVLSGLSEVIHWHDLKKKKGAVLIDVRPVKQREAGTIEGSVSIPLDRLRDRTEELDKDKQYIVFSQSGHRSYLAERLLRQRGFKVKNLSGGFCLYEIFSGTE